MKPLRTSLVLLALMVTAAACTEQDVAVRKGPWEVEYRGAWSPKEGRKLWEHVLYRHEGSERVLVARHVRGYEFYPGDCIIFHGTGPGPGGFFAACGTRRPLRLSGPEDAWRKMGDHFELLESKGSGVVVKERRLIQDILKQAKLQPLDSHAAH